MIYKRFTFLIILRISLLIANVLVIAAILGDKRLGFNQIILGLILIFQVAELVRFVNHTNREITRMFNAIKHSDFSISFKPSTLGNSFRELGEAMIEIIYAYKKVKIEKEAQFHFLQLLVNQLHVGIIAIENHETITLINPTAQRLTGVAGLKNWKLFEQLNPLLWKELEELGEHGKKLVELKSAGESQFISAAVSTLIILDKPLTLITLQNINSEIEQKEIESWHKLIRILTHEIMNSVTPISSLTETMASLLEHKDGSEKQLPELHQDTVSDIRFSLNTIQKRTSGLLQFVDNYRRLSKIPKPTLVETDMKSFVLGAVKLLEHEFARKGIRVKLELAEGLTTRLDHALVEQVLINIIMNGVHAVENSADPVIGITTVQQDNHLVVTIRDNGKGMSAKELPEIFVPFYTTKKEGSGIGLSLSKQIMAVHGGFIKVQSEVNAGSTFFLHFNRNA